MAKKNPLFLNGGDFEVIDGSTDTIDDDLIQNSSASLKGLMSAAHYSKLEDMPDQTKLFECAVTAGIPAGTLCYVDASSKAVIASYSSKDSRACMVSLYASDLGSSKAYGMQNYGEATLGSGLTIGKPVYLGASGAPTSAAPSTGGLVVQHIGAASAADKVLIDIESAVIIN